MTVGCLGGCREAESTGVKESLAEADAGAPGTDSLLKMSKLFTDRDLAGKYTEKESSVIALGSGNVIISEGGTYILQGSAENAVVIVDAEETAKIQLVLDGVRISNQRQAAIYVKNADKVFLTLADGSENVLENAGSYTQYDDNHIDAVIFAKSDLTLNGSGNLTVIAAEGHGIVSKDDLKLTGGKLTVSAPGHGLSGKDSVRIWEAELILRSGKDGIHAGNAEAEDKGFVYIGSGSLTIEAEGDGISAGSSLQIDGGSFVLTTGGSSANQVTTRDENGDIVSTKGVKAGGSLTVCGGDFRIDSQDDALHANGNLSVLGGEFEISTGDDALHADETTTVGGGSLQINTCYEGVEGNAVVISGGTVRLCATDDGINAAGGNDGSGFGGRFGGRFGGESDSYILISGGELYINASGDGLDANGDLTVTGGRIFVSGSESDGDGALDYDGTGQITGGKLVAVGRSGMAMNFGDTSTQGSILVSTVECAAGTEVTLLGVEGEALISYTAESSFNSVVVSCPELKQGSSYTITAGVESCEVTLDSLIYGSGFGGMGDFGGGRPGGGMGEKWKGDSERPEMPEGRDGFVWDAPENMWTEEDNP